MSELEPVTYSTRRTCLVWTGGQALAAVAAALACVPLALLGAPLMAGVGGLLGLAVAFSLGRAVWRETFGRVGPRLVLDAEGLGLRNLGGRVAQRLPWSWVAGLEVDEAEGTMVVVLAGGRRIRDGKPLVMPLRELPEAATATCRAVDSWLRRGRAPGELPPLLDQSRWKPRETPGRRR